MGKYFITLPSMGESVVEATLTNWLKEVGDKINVDDPIVEIATDKVDSDITSEYQGILLEKKFDKDDVIKVGDVIAVIESSEFQEENIQEKDDIVELDLSKNKDFNSEIKNDLANLRFCFLNIFVNSLMCFVFSIATAIQIHACDAFCYLLNDLSNLWI